MQGWGTGDGLRLLASLDLISYVPWSFLLPDRCVEPGYSPSFSNP